MSSYNHFAFVYDDLTENVEYEKRFHYMMSFFKEYNIQNGARILDLACGTGSFSLLFANAGYRVTGMDASEQMLTVADSKCGGRANFLKGDMCFIGPRPLLPVYDCEYQEWELIKFEMRPGLTGLSQVRGNGHLTIKARKYYDAYYVLHASPLLDLKIIFKTIAVLLVGEKRFLKRVPPEDYVTLKNEVGKRLKISDRTYKNFKVTPTIGADIAVRTENAGTYGKSGADAALAEAAATGAVRQKDADKQDENGGNKPTE